MSWQAVQVGIAVIGLALIFASVVGAATGHWWILIITGAGLLALAVLQVRTARRRREWSHRQE